MKAKPMVSVVMGSESDLPVVRETAAVLGAFGIAYEMRILSAHRTPKETHAFASASYDRGIRVIIAAAGGAAHLAGVIASLFPLPVIGIPMATPTLGGVDSLYSTVQMPPGVPVATVGINAAKNAGLLAAEILAVDDASLTQKLIAFRKHKTQAVLKKSEALTRGG